MLSGVVRHQKCWKHFHRIVRVQIMWIAVGISLLSCQQVEISRHCKIGHFIIHAYRSWPRLSLWLGNQITLRWWGALEKTVTAWPRYEPRPLYRRFHSRIIQSLLARHGLAPGPAKANAASRQLNDTKQGDEMKSPTKRLFFIMNYEKWNMKNRVASCNVLCFL